ncbi:MAG: sensor domain-containing diguanylate cyclase [Burkholderiaceae bacterium]
MEPSASADLPLHSTTALPYASFNTAVMDVLRLLRARLGFDVWMVTRVSDDRLIVLHALDHSHGVTDGAVLSWPDSICRQMVLGNGPNIAPDVHAVAGYAVAAAAQQRPIGAYIGLPLCSMEGEVLGTLCAIDKQIQPAQLVAEQPLLELLGRLLSSLLQAERLRETVARRYERLRIEAQTDALSGLFNRRAWDRLLASEEERCRRHSHPAAVLVIDLDGLKFINDQHGHAAGDRLIERIGRALRAAAREIDIVARIGGDEFGVLGIECDTAGAQALADRVRAALQDAGINASVGFAARDVAGGLQAAWQTADQRMYEEKSQRRGGFAVEVDRA